MVEAELVAAENATGENAALLKLAARHIRALHRLIREIKNVERMQQGRAKPYNPHLTVK
jgi:hypothetical protein